MSAQPALLRATARQASRICETCKPQRQHLPTTEARTLPTTRHYSSATATPASTSRPRAQVPSSQQWVTTPAATLRRQPFSSTPTTQSSSSSSSSSHSTSDDKANSASQSPPKSHYDLFPQTLPDGPPPRSPFPIDVRALRREFLRLQASAHPDLHPPAMKSRAEATSALINEAFKTLLDPLLRAQYLIQQRTGEDLAEDERAKVEDPELLMEVLEAREAVEDAQEESDLEGLQAVNEQRIRESEEVMARAFGEDDLDAARAECVRLRYWKNIQESIRNWERGKPVVLQH